MKRKITFLIAAAIMLFLTLFTLPEAVWGQEKSDTKTEGFESATTSTTYNSTVTIAENKSDCGIGWTINYGTVSTNDKISGSNSAQMRWYSSATSNYPYITSTTAVNDLTNIAFKAKVSSTNVKMDVLYSTDKSSWTSIASAVTFSGTNAADFEYDIPSGGKYIKIGVSSSSTAPTSGNYKFIIDDVVFTYGAAPTVATPTFDIAAGTYYANQTVTISCDTDGSTIYYTTDGTTPSNTNGAQGTSVTISAEGETTLKAIAYVGENASSVATRTYTIHHPLTTMDAIFEKASENNGDSKSVYVTFNNWVVTGVKNKQAFVTDGIKGFIVYKNSDGNNPTGFKVGDILSGTTTVPVNLQLYNGAAEFTTLTASTYGLTVTTGGTVSPQAVTIGDMSGVNTGAIVTINGLTYNSTTGLLSDGVNSISPYTTLYSGSFTDGSTYNITGVYQQQSSAPHRILPRNAADIVEILDPVITAATSIAVPNYVVGTPQANIANVTLAVTGSNLTEDITAELYDGSNFEISNDNTNWDNTTTISQSEGTADGTIFVRLKHNLSIENYDDIINLSSGTADDVDVDISASVIYAHVTYDGNGSTSGSVPSDETNYSYNDMVTVLGNTGNLAKTHYSFSSWNTKADGSGTNYAEDATFNITDNITLYAQWAVNSNNITMPVEDIYGTYTASPSNPVNYNAEVTLTFTPKSGYENYLAVWSVNGDPIVGNSFNMLDETVTVTVNLIPKYSVTYNGNGDDGTGSVPTDATLYASGSQVTVKGNTGSLKKDGKFWNGWNTETDGSGIHYNADSKFEITGNTTLYAEWRNPYKYTLAESITPGKHYIIVGQYESNVYAMGAQSGSVRSCVNVTISSNQITELADIYEISISGSGTNDEPYTIYSIKDKKYICAVSSSSNNIGTQQTLSNDGKWSISISDGCATVAAKGNCSRKQLRFNYNNGGPRFTCYADNTTMSKVSLYERNDNTIEIQSPTTISSTTSVTDLSVTSTANNPLTIANGATLTVTGTLTNANAANLIIEDGGQLIVNNAGVQATVKKSVATWNGSLAKGTNPGWQTISTSTRDAEDGSTIAFTNVENLIYLDGSTPRYNVYSYDEAGIQWINNLGASGFDELTVGQGYIYRTGGSTDLEYKGYVNTGDIDVILAYGCGTSSFKGFNLIGNPYTHTIYKGTAVSAIPNGSLLEEGYYALNLETGMFTVTDDGTAIPRGTAIMVQAKDQGGDYDPANYTLTMANSTSGASGSKAGNDNIWFSVKNENFQDFACVKFKPGRGLNKIDHQNENAPMLYINHNGENFGSVNMSDDTKSINLNFKAMTMGKYTLSLKPEGNFSYIHVIDKLTGEDIDMLLEGEYSFIASPSDADNRFIVRLGYQPDYGNDNDIFAYQSGSEIYVTGDGELQVFDVTGRRVMTATINGAKSISIPNQGVYIFRLNEKVQKIVVR